jgi:hypothetical protein
LTFGQAHHHSGNGPDLSALDRVNTKPVRRPVDLFNAELGKARRFDLAKESFSEIPDAMNSRASGKPA